MMEKDRQMSGDTKHNELIESPTPPEYIEDDVKKLAGLPDDFAPPTPAEEAAVIRRLDLHLLPYVFLLYMLAVLDRSNLGNARTAGLNKAIDLKGFNYNWLGTIFYIACKRIVHVLSTYLMSSRYFIAMDFDRMEGFPTPHVLCFRSLLLGFHRNNSGSRVQLARHDGLPVFPGYR